MKAEEKAKAEQERLAVQAAFDADAARQRALLSPAEQVKAAMRAGVAEESIERLARKARIAAMKVR